MSNANDWWRGASVYQIFPRSYYDTKGDGIGDLPGITAKMPYLRDLNIDAVWISPFFLGPAQPVDAGYDVVSYRDVDPIFGTNEDADKLIQTAKAHDIKIIIDGVYSHSSNEHAWFVESSKSRDNPKADWYVWADARLDDAGERRPPNNWKSVFGGSAWEWHDDRQQFYLHNFATGQPDLNLHNPDVQQAVLGEAEFWLKKGVMGIRLDACNCYMHDLQLRDNPQKPWTSGVNYTDYHNIHNQSQPEILPFLKKFRALTDAYPGSFLVGEIGDDRGLAMARDYTGDGKLHTAYGFAYLVDGISAEYLKNIDAYMQTLPDGGPLSIAFSNHDFPRAASRWGNDNPTPERSIQLNYLLGMMGETIFLYQGEELGLPTAYVPPDRIVDPAAKKAGSATRTRDGARTPIPWDDTAPHGGFSTSGDTWLPVDPDHLPLAVSVQEKNPNSVLNATRDFLAWRRENKELLVDAPIHYYGDMHDPLLAFRRGEGENKIVCLFNMTNKTQEYRIHNYDLIEDLTGSRPGIFGASLTYRIPPAGVLIKTPENIAPAPIARSELSNWTIVADAANDLVADTLQALQKQRVKMQYVPERTPARRSA